MPKTQMDRETDLYTALGGVRWRLAQAAAALQAEEPSPDLLRQGLCPQCRPRVVTDRLALGSPGH